MPGRMMLTVQGYGGSPPYIVRGAVLVEATGVGLRNCWNCATALTASVKLTAPSPLGRTATWQVHR